MLMLMLMVMVMLMLATRRPAQPAANADADADADPEKQPYLVVAFPMSTRRVDETLTVAESRQLADDRRWYAAFLVANSMTTGNDSYGIVEVVTAAALGREGDLVGGHLGPRKRCMKGQ
ncbi:hypothetical protein IWZ03DRAFT_234081 [Phyllosticta citriasiana]|uniref:Secreted protein n=1 Tax=Phyllosticta citriasiana TaxID=595635 RepID=A0ABR1KHV1_9PEZI